MTKVRILDNSMNADGWRVGDEVELEPTVAVQYSDEGKVELLEQALKIEKEAIVEPVIIKKKVGRPKK